MGTLAALLDLYGEKRGNAQKAWPESRKRINLVCNPLLAKPVAAVSASDFQMVVDTPKDAEGRHTIVIIAAQAAAPLPQQGTAFTSRSRKHWARGSSRYGPRCTSTSSPCSHHHP